MAHHGKTALSLEARRAKCRCSTRDSVVCPIPSRAPVHISECFPNSSGCFMLWWSDCKLSLNILLSYQSSKAKCTTHILSIEGGNPHQLYPATLGNVGTMYLHCTPTWGEFRYNVLALTRKFGYVVPTCPPPPGGHCGYNAMYPQCLF